jgi:hypothetical protein
MVEYCLLRFSPEVDIQVDSGQPSFSAIWETVKPWSKSLFGGSRMIKSGFKKVGVAPSYTPIVSGSTLKSSLF